MTPKEALAVLKAAYRTPDLEDATIRLYVGKLAAVPPRVLGAVVDRAIERCRFFPSIAELLEVASALSPSGHPGPEEAWALVAGLEEDDTVVWTDQIAHAWGVASQCLPDRVAARLAFVEVYRKQLAEAAPAPRWWASVGHDVGRRAGPVQDAVLVGRLSAGEGRAALPPESWPASLRPALPPGPPDAHAEDVKGLIHGLMERLQTSDDDAARAKARQLLKDSHAAD
mgnify:CR=1 FL=1